MSHPFDQMGNVREWAEVNYVTDIMKDRLWKSLIPHFALQATKDLNLA
jgi:hypothetical protein